MWRAPTVRVVLAYAGGHFAGGGLPGGFVHLTAPGGLSGNASGWTGVRGTSGVCGEVRGERGFFEPLHPSFFELTTAMAMRYFADERVDVAVIEVGMGGRLDCTNIIKPYMGVITNIGMDHTQYLGDTLEKIAAEKAGIIKAGTCGGG